MHLKYKNRHFKRCAAIVHVHSRQISCCFIGPSRTPRVCTSEYILAGLTTVWGAVGGVISPAGPLTF